MFDVEVFSNAGIGKNNEDYVLHVEIAPEIPLIIVCDGLGGLSNGATAAVTIAHCIGNYLKQNFCSRTPSQSIISAMRYANDEVAKECIRLKTKMGASVALILFVGNSCYYSGLGDVRIYRAKGCSTELLTKDHLAIEGNHSFLSRCINGKEFRHSPEVGELAISVGEEIVIVTDGYYLRNKVSSQIGSVLTAEDDATFVCIRPT